MLQSHYKQFTSSRLVNRNYIDMIFLSYLVFVAHLALCSWVKSFQYPLTLGCIRE